MFTSDNGGEVGVTVNAHLREGKSFTYEGGVRVPLVMEYPSLIASGSVTDVPTTNLDFYPTFAELTGYDIPSEHITDGASIMPLLRGEEDPDLLSQRPLAWHYPLEQPHGLGGRSSAANRNDQFKFIHFFDDGADELYDLKNDESETTNLVTTHREQREELKGQLKNWIADVNGCMPEGQTGIE